MVDFKPFKPYSSVDIEYLREARQYFDINEWIDVYCRRWNMIQKGLPL